MNKSSPVISRRKRAGTGSNTLVTIMATQKESVSTARPPVEIQIIQWIEVFSDIRIVYIGISNKRLWSLSGKLICSAEKDLLKDS